MAEVERVGVLDEDGEYFWWTVPVDSEVMLGENDPLGQRDDAEQRCQQCSTPIHPTKTRCFACEYPESEA